MKPRRQCKKCPWRKGVDPNDIPNGYCVVRHENLHVTIAKPALLPVPGSPLRMMACHETMVGKELACVGWLAQQLGPGNDLGLRMAVLSGNVDANFRTVGPQHATFEETLPR